MEVVGEFLGLDQDAAIYRYFRRHHPGWFPALLRVHRTTFTRQAANLWVVKEQAVAAAAGPGAARSGALLRRLRARPRSAASAAPTPAPASGARPPSAVTPAAKPPSTASAHHLRISWPGVVTAVSVAPANVHDRDLVPELVEGATGQVLGDRNYWDPQADGGAGPGRDRAAGPVQETRHRSRPGRQSACSPGCAGASRRWPPSSWSATTSSASGRAMPGT